jgi:hypothetical protein
MLTSSRFLTSASPRCCMFCGEPFRPRDGYVEVWRTSAGPAAVAAHVAGSTNI